MPALPHRMMSFGLVAAVLALSAGGCGFAYRPYFDPGGSGVAIDEYTYVSQPGMPQSVRIIDTRTGETVFASDIPVGEQLVINFDDDVFPEHETMTAEMRWRLMPAGNRYGQLRNRVPMPPASSRRVDLFVRQTPELPEAMGGPSPRVVGGSASAAPAPQWTPPATTQAPPASEAPIAPATPPAQPMEPMQPVIDLD